MLAYVILIIFGLMKPTETIDFHIRWTWHKIARMYNLEATGNGLSMAIGYALLNIDQKDGTPSTHLGPKMGMEPRSLVRLLKTMETKGFITREPDAKDKRMVRLTLTAKGKKKREISRKTVIGFNEAVQDRIDPRKLKIFFEVITEINEIAELGLLETPRLKSTG